MTRLVTLYTNGLHRPAVVVGDEVLDVGAYQLTSPDHSRLPGSVADILAGGDSMLTAVDAMVDGVGSGSDASRQALRNDGALIPLDAARLAAPLPNPGLVICCGHTYAEHVREMRGNRPNHIAGFIKNSHSVIGTGQSIELPAGHRDMIDFEGELAMVIGRRCHHLSVDEAWDCIAGYVILNDVSARDWVDEARSTGNMFFNELGKQFPTFCPLGPWVVTANELGDPHNLQLRTTLNGEIMQSASTSELSYSVAEILSFWSQWYRFEPGDIVSTGSPAGVGAARTPPVYLRPGDTVTVEISGCGKLVNPVKGPAATLPTKG